MERRLAAIMAADVAGYSRMMRADETGTLAALQGHLAEAIGPAISRHRGRIVNAHSHIIAFGFLTLTLAVLQSALDMKERRRRQLAVLVIGGSLVWRYRTVTKRVTAPLNAIGTVLLGVNLVIIGAFFANVRPTVVVTGPGLTMSPAPTQAATLPDVYWVILDRYASGNVVDRYYGYDNEPFLDELRSRGFYVAEHATANYLKTALSLSSSRDMDYLDFADLRAQATADDDWGPLYRDLAASFQVEHYLGSAGYRFIYLGTYWGPTARHASAEISYVYDQLTSEFLDVLAGSTVLRAFQALGPDAPYDWRRNRWNQTRYEWESLSRASALPGPKFVHAHFALPHEPYVFHADGSFVTEAEEAARSREANYVDQLQFANAQVLTWLDTLQFRLGGPVRFALSARLVPGPEAAAPESPAPGTPPRAAPAEPVEPEATARPALRHFVDQRRGDPCSGRSDRVAKGDGAAVDVGARQVDPEIALAGQDLGGERLVELDQIDVLESQAGAVQ